MNKNRAVIYAYRHIHSLKIFSKFYNGYIKCSSLSQSYSPKIGHFINNTKYNVLALF